MWSSFRSRGQAARTQRTTCQPARRPPTCTFEAVCEGGVEMITLPRTLMGLIAIIGALLIMPPIAGAAEPRAWTLYARASGALSRISLWVSRSRPRIILRARHAQDQRALPQSPRRVSLRRDPAAPEGVRRRPSRRPRDRPRRGRRHTAPAAGRDAGAP